MKHIPNILTLANLLTGCIGIVLLLEGSAFEAAYFVWIACVFDFFDGFAARWLKVTSPLGKELDSLADMVSFGVLPSVVMYSLLLSAFPGTVIPFFAFLLAAFSALRLAIFNLDASQSHSFRGLPTPANAIFLSSLPMLPIDWAAFGWLSLVIVVVFSWLLVSPIRLFSLKFRNFTWQSNKFRFTFLTLGVLLLVILGVIAIPVLILLYIVLSLVSRKELNQ